MVAAVNTAPVSRFAANAAFWNGKRVFVTGHTGFKGSWLVVWLSALGAKVRGYALAPEWTPSMYRLLALDELCDSVISDIRELDRLTRAIREFSPEIVIHMAAQPLVRSSYVKPLETFQVNVQGTANVLEVCRDIPSVRAVVIVTTDKCYENPEHQRAFVEDDALGGADPYSASKAAAELVTTAYRRSFFAMEKSARVASARAGNVIGGGDWGEDRIVPDAARALSEGRPLAVRNPQAVRPWQHVVSPLSGYLMLARALYEEGAGFAIAFNFGPASDQVLSVRQIADFVVGAWGGGAKWIDASKPGEPHEAGYLMLDSTRAQERLNWLPEGDLARGISLTVDWYKSHYAGARAPELRQLTMRHIKLLAPLGGGATTGS